MQASGIPWDGQRAYPARAQCTHDVAGSTCLCIDKCAEWLQQQIAATFPEDAASLPDSLTDTSSRFHKEALAYSRANTFSIVAPPLLPCAPLMLRSFGPWHNAFNSEKPLWLQTRDGAATYGVLGALQGQMKKLNLGHIKVWPLPKPN